MTHTHAGLSDVQRIVVVVDFDGRYCAAPEALCSGTQVSIHTLATTISTTDRRPTWSEQGSHVLAPMTNVLFTDNRSMSPTLYVTVALASTDVDGWINGTIATLGSPLTTAWATYAYGLLLSPLRTVTRLTISSYLPSPAHNHSKPCLPRARAETLPRPSGKTCGFAGVGLRAASWPRAGFETWAVSGEVLLPCQNQPWGAPPQ